MKTPPNRTDSYSLVLEYIKALPVGSEVYSKIVMDAIGAKAVFLNTKVIGHALGRIWRERQWLQSKAKPKKGYSHIHSDLYVRADQPESMYS